MTNSPDDGVSFARSRFWVFLLFLLLLVIAVFAGRNAQPVEVDLLAHQTRVPLAVLLLVTFAAGMVAGVAGAAPVLRAPPDRPGNLRLLVLMLGPSAVVILLGILLALGWW